MERLKVAHCVTGESSSNNSSNVKPASFSIDLGASYSCDDIQRKALYFIREQYKGLCNLRIASRFGMGNCCDIFPFHWSRFPDYCSKIRSFC